MIAVLDWELCTLGHPFADLAFISIFSLINPATIITSGIGGEGEQGGRGEERERERERGRERTLTFPYSVRVDTDIPPGVPNEEELTRMYSALMKLPHPLPDWPFFKALSCFRMASIVQVHTIQIQLYI